MLPLPHLREASRPAARSCTTGTLPAYVDPAQPPTKKQPFAALRAQKWISSLEVMLPREIAGIVRQDLASRFLRYAKVMLKLHDLLDGDLFTEGIKRGSSSVYTHGRLFTLGERLTGAREYHGPERGQEWSRQSIRVV